MGRGAQLGAYPGGFCARGGSSCGEGLLAVVDIPGSQGTISTAAASDGRPSLAPSWLPSDRPSSASWSSQVSSHLPFQTLSVCRGSNSGLSSGSPVGTVGLGVIAPLHEEAAGHPLGGALSPLPADSPMRTGCIRRQSCPQAGSDFFVGLSSHHMEASLRDFQRKLEAEREEHALERRQWQAERSRLKEEAAAPVASTEPRRRSSGPARWEGSGRDSVVILTSDVPRPKRIVRQGPRPLKQDQQEDDIREARLLPIPPRDGGSIGTAAGEGGGTLAPSFPASVATTARDRSRLVQVESTDLSP